MLIRHLLREGEPKAVIARKMKISRQTVYNHAVAAEGGKTRQRRVSKLDDHKAYLTERLRNYDIPATGLLKEVRQRGYTGSITILRDYVRQYKKLKTAAITERFETIPGQQAQIDWGECGTIVDRDGIRRRLYVFVMVLGFSRIMFARFTTSTKVPILLSCMQEGFARLGVAREILVDNMKQAVERHTLEGVRYQKEFLDFCSHYATLPLAAPPYWPRVKGKVERGVGYVKHSFLEGRSFTDVVDLNAQLDLWLDGEANLRIHGTTGERPVDRHQQEIAYLGPYTAFSAYDVRTQEIRKVATDSHIRFHGVFYSVDPIAVGQSVALRPSGNNVGDHFDVVWNGGLIARHTIAPRAVRRVTLLEHAAAIRKLARRGGGRRPWRVSFLQLLPSPERPLPAPEVEIRSLDLYERLLSGGTK